MATRIYIYIYMYSRRSTSICSICGALVRVKIFLEWIGLGGVVTRFCSGNTIHFFLINLKTYLISIFGQKAHKACSWPRFTSRDWIMYKSIVFKSKLKTNNWITVSLNRSFEILDFTKRGSDCTLHLIFSLFQRLSCAPGSQWLTMYEN